jgi:hypothetical protein
VDEEAVYVTSNMFPLTNQTARFNCLLWIVAKNPWYTGGNPSNSWKVYDYLVLAGSGVRTTHMPAMVRGGGIPGNVGTYLVAYSGLRNVNIERVQIIEIINPLNNPTFRQAFVSLGDIERADLPLPQAEQLGRPERIETNDRRALDAVWVNNQLWMVFTVRSAGRANGYWVKLNANGVNFPPSVNSGAPITGADLGPNMYTYFPSIDVNSNGIAAFGFSASSSGLYAGAYATIRDDNADPVGRQRPSDVVRAGVAPYYITFSGTRNRWGDYTGMALDPVEDRCFWAYNQYASQPCYTFTVRDQSGCWNTAWAR